MRLINLVYHINNLNDLCQHLEKEKRELNLQVQELMSKGEILYTTGSGKYSDEQVKIRKDIMELNNKIDTLKRYQKSIHSIWDVEVQIPTKI